MPYRYSKARCSGCGREISHTSWGTPRHHNCPHGTVCVCAYSVLSQGEPSTHPKAATDARYKPCRECATAHGWLSKISQWPTTN
jgi:hypothetical protein